MAKLDLVKGFCSLERLIGTKNALEILQRNPAYDAQLQLSLEESVDLVGKISQEGTAPVEQIRTLANVFTRLLHSVYECHGLGCKKKRKRKKSKEKRKKKK